MNNSFGLIDKTRLVLPTKYRKAHLTPAETRIVGQLMQGFRAKEIAYNMSISVHTVNSHVSNIKTKLDCNNSFQLGFFLAKYESNLQIQ